MMDQLFLTVWEMSIQGTIISVFALLAGHLLKWARGPRGMVFLMWGVILFRLLCPVTLSSPYSPLNIPAFQSYLERFHSAADGYTGDYQVAVDVPGGSEEFDRVTAAGIQPVTSELGFDVVYYEEGPDGSLTPAKTSRETQIPILSKLWAAGVAAMALYGAVSYRLLRRRLQFAVRAQGNVWESDRIASPCVVGFFRPQIYLTFGLSPQQREHILCHEEEHIRHGDPFWKLAAYLTLCIHWFNPYCWMLFRAFQEDLEMACDERVIRRLGADCKEAYSESLLALSVRRKRVSPCPLAFGENATKSRVKNVLRFRKPLLGAVLLTGAAALLLAGAFLTGPQEGGAGRLASVYQLESPLYGQLPAGETPRYQIREDGSLWRLGEEDWERCGPLTAQRKPTEVNFPRFFPQAKDQGVDPAAIAAQCKALYRVNMQSEEGHPFFLLVEGKDGSLLLGQGASSPEGDALAWFCPLRPVSGSQWQQELYHHRTPYIGDNSEVGAILTRLSFPSDWQYQGFVLSTGEEPYGVSVRFQAGPDVLAAYTAKGKYQIPLLKDAAYLLSLTGNAGWVEFYLEDGSSPPTAFRYTREEMDSLVGADLWEESRTEGRFLRLCQRIEEHIPQAVTEASSLAGPSPQPEG